MQFVFLDEFGHIGPFVHRQDARFNTSPVFGLSGIILPENAVRNFSTAFLQLKSSIFSSDILKAGVPAFKWEKKGSDIFRPKAMGKYPELRNAGFRLLNQLLKSGGHTFYYGIEKQVDKLDGNPIGLYTTALAHAIRRIDQHCQEMNSNFVLVVDQHSAHHDLLECAAKTMFGQQPARRLLSPPFEVESYLNQNMQAADWIASITGRLWAFELQPVQYADHQKTKAYYWDRLHQVAVHSAVNRRKPPRLARRSSMDRHQTDDSVMANALRKAGFDPTL